MKRRRILQIVDSREYILSNCFQSQLHSALSTKCGVTMVTPHDITNVNISAFDVVLSTLKQRTLLKVCTDLRKYLRDVPVVVYDQDPWEAFRDDGPYKGSYFAIAEALNVKFFAVTTEWWSRFIESQQKLPCKFVRMWLLPGYCTQSRPFTDRNVNVGFIGGLHPYRKELFDYLNTQGVNVNIQPNRFSYSQYMNEVTNIKIVVHQEKMTLSVDGSPVSYGTGLWIKDIEACARGCFSIRNIDEGWDTYLKNVPTCMLYSDMSEAPNMISKILNMDDRMRQAMIDETVSYIQNANLWDETIDVLTT